MYSNLRSQYICSRTKDDKTTFQLQPHYIDVTDLVKKYKTATNTDIVKEYSSYVFSGPRGPHIDQVYFVYDNDDPENGKKYYILRNSPHREYGATGLFAIIKLDKKEQQHVNLTTSRIDYSIQQYLWSIIVVACIIIMIMGSNLILQISMIIPAIIALMGAIQAWRRNEKQKDSSYEPVIKGTQIVGFRKINNIDVETVAKALDLGYEDRIKHIFHTPEEYLTDHLQEMKKEIDIAYELQAAKVNPANYIYNYSPEQLKIMDEIDKL